MLTISMLLLGGAACLTVGYARVRRHRRRREFLDHLRTVLGKMEETGKEGPET